jgi:hypothetical protein
VRLILDLAVVVLALAVIGSLATLSWTFAVTAVRATHGARRQVEAKRRSVAEAEARLLAATERASTTLARLSNRTATGDRFDR